MVFLLFFSRLMKLFSCYHCFHWNNYFLERKKKSHYLQLYSVTIYLKLVEIFYQILMFLNVKNDECFNTVILNLRKTI